MDTATSQAQTPPPVTPQGQVPPVVSPSPQQSAQVQPAYPGSGPSKEHAPIVGVRVEAPVAEYIKPHGSEQSPEVPQEVAEAGVEVVKNHEQPQLTPEHKAVGIEVAKEAVPVAPAPQTIQLPFSPAQIPHIKKEEPVTSGKHWLAVFTEYLMKRIQLKQ